MQQKTSIKWNIISYDRSSLEKDIETILKSRFNEDDFKLNGMENLLDPYLLADMDKAVKRIKQAVENHERIFIFWDYDVDGVTSTSILMHFFTKIKAHASYRLPHRVKDWYGLKKYFVDEAKDLDVKLIITVDCWTRDIDIIKHAKSLGIDIIVTDHHAVPEIIPEEAVAIINPKRKDCKYPNKNLAWAWVAFKLMSALAKEYFSEEECKQYLIESIDIAAIWTVADCMSLVWENRIIVLEGLKQLKKSRSKWIRKLIEDKIHEDLDADVFGFTIWPRLNAAWRMDSPYKAVNLILNNGDTLNATFMEIEKLNDKRKILTKSFVEEALTKINRQDNLLFYVSKDIVHWIIWIIAWRLSEQFHKPSIVLKDEWDKLVASCRSPEYFSMIDLLEKHKEYFIGFGWHKQAAWFSIEKSKFIDFKKAILSEVNSMDFSNNKKQLDITKVVRLDELWFNFLSKLNKFKPYGIWNPKPLLMVENLDYNKLDFLWQWRDHLRFSTKSWFKIFWFFMGDYYEEIKRWKSVSLVFDLNEDSWMWKKNLMLKIVDIIVE